MQAERGERGGNKGEEEESRKIWKMAIWWGREQETDERLRLGGYKVSVIVTEINTTFKKKNTSFVPEK